MTEPTTVYNTVKHIMKSEFTGRTYRVSVALPESYASSSDTEYPVLYVADANLLFGTVVETSRLGAVMYEIPELIIVGFDSVVDSVVTSTLLRNRDLTPVPSKSLEQMMKQLFSGNNDIATGGAENYKKFICKELQPFVNRNYRVNVNDRGYFGHSLGGLFGYYMLFHEPDTFTRYIIGSPSLWYEEEITFAYEKTYAEGHDDLPARIFTAVGGLEEPKNIEALANRKMVTNTKRMADILRERNYPNLQISDFIFDHMTHASVAGAIFGMGMISVYDAPPIPSEMQAYTASPENK